MCKKNNVYIAYVGLGETVFLLPHVRYVTYLYKSIDNVNYRYSQFIFPNLTNFHY